MTWTDIGGPPSIALKNVAGDYQVTSAIDVTMKYFPFYLIVPEG